MTSTSNKTVVLGVTGSIAAYKACEIASLLVKRGLNVIPVLSASAQQLVGPTTFEALTGNTAITAMFQAESNLDVEHINVSQRAGLFIIAPATANVIAKAAVGIADDWLTTALLATRAPLLFAPAMNTLMYEHGATQENLSILKLRGAHIVDPEEGLLACKTIGIGKMAAPEKIVERALALLNRTDELRGRRVLITSGANHEPIDPVRFIGNRSSGKMGRAVAFEALRRGAEVTVVTGPAEVAPPDGCRVLRVQTAEEMLNAARNEAGRSDVIIGVAAVADYRIAEPFSGKHKRNGQDMTLRLVENPDVIGSLGAEKRPGQVIVGFAAETNDLIENAKDKIARKRLDLIVANEVGKPESGFGTDTLKASLISAEGHVDDLPLCSKDEVAARLMDKVAALLTATGTPISHHAAHGHHSHHHG